jgi:hypothetical protein
MFHLVLLLNVKFSKLAIKKGPDWGPISTVSACQSRPVSPRYLAASNTEFQASVMA